MGLDGHTVDFVELLSEKDIIGQIPFVSCDDIPHKRNWGNM